MVQGGTLVPRKNHRFGFGGSEPVLVGPDVLFHAWSLSSPLTEPAWDLLENGELFPVITARELAIFFGLLRGATDADRRAQAEYWNRHLSLMVGVLRYENKFGLQIPRAVVRFRLTDARVAHATTLLAMRHWGVQRYFTFARSSMLWLSEGTGISVEIPPGGRELLGPDEVTD